MSNLWASLGSPTSIVVILLAGVFGGVGLLAGLSLLLG